MAQQKKKATFIKRTQGTTVGGAGVEDKAAPTAKDKLGFKPYVDAVFSFLHNESTKPPFTMSVEGEWGSGKSSFMLQLEEALNSKGELTISFNAWRHDKIESMWSAFAIDFVEKLSKVQPWYLRWWAYLRLYFKGFDFVKGLPSLLLKILLTGFFIYLIFFLLQPEHMAVLLDVFTKEETAKIDVENILEIVGWWGLLIFGFFLLKKVADVVGNPLTIDLKKFNNSPDYSSKAAFIESFHEDIDKTLEILVGKSKKVFVFIDDLDRAEVPKAAELMQGLNMMISNSSKLIFIIGMDREKVAAGIAARYKDLLVFLNPNQASLDTTIGIHQALDFGYNFLEKFIQLSFRIPSPSPESIKEFLKSLNNNEAEKSQEPDTSEVIPNFRISVGEDSPEFKETVTAIAPYLENNPRRLKQFVNAFRLKAHIAFNTGLFQNDPSLTLPKLGKFVALLLRWPLIADDLSVYPGLIRELADFHAEDHVEENKSPLAKKWKHDTRLIEFLNIKSSDESDDLDYDLASIDIESLLRTSPGISFSKDSFNRGSFNKEQVSNEYVQSSAQEFPLA